jgi:hypothetical protein
MSDIARKLTGWTKRDLLEAETPPARFARQFVILPGTTPRGVRVMVGLMEGIGDRDRERGKLLRNTPEALEMP